MLIFPLVNSVFVDGVHAGTWYTILQFINVVGVVTNACLIAFTSAWGKTHDKTGQMIIMVVFEVGYL